MRRLAMILLALACGVATASHAQSDPGANGVGIYFDQDATINCLTTAAGTPVTAYVVATRLDPTSGGVAGFEFRLLTNPADFPAGLQITLPPGGINVVAPPHFQVGLPAPLPWAPAITLLTLSFAYAGGSVILGLGSNEPCNFTLPYCIDVAAGNDPGRLILLVPASHASYQGAPRAFAVAGINAGPGCPVEGDRGSWGALKGLYR